MSYIYELPFGKGKHFGGDSSRWVDALLGGWQVNGITTFQSETPLSISASNTAGIFNQTIRANGTRKSGKLTTPVDQRLEAYFDKTAFAQPVASTFGNLSPRQIQLGLKLLW